jgi:hypothetical protein
VPVTINDWCLEPLLLQMTVKTHCIALQVFVALLRAVQPDVKRPLVREALDILTPALPTRLAPGASLDRTVLVCLPIQSPGVRSVA